MPTRIGFRVTAAEYDTIKTNSEAAGMTISSFLKHVGQHMVPKSKKDHEDIKDLIKISADLAKLGNLLKMALTGDSHWREIGPDTVTDLYDAIEETRSLLTDKIKTL